MFQIIFNDFANGLRQDHASLAAPLFSDPKEAISNIDIGDLDISQRVGPQPEGPQKHDNDKVSNPPEIVWMCAEITDVPVVLVRLWRIPLESESGERFFRFWDKAALWRYYHQPCDSRSGNDKTASTSTPVIFGHGWKGCRSRRQTQPDSNS